MKNLFKHKKIIIFILLLIVVGAVLFFNSKNKKEQPLKSVNTISLEKKTIEDTISIKAPLEGIYFKNP